MQLTLLKGYPDFVGKRQILCGFGKGPVSYVQQASGGDVISTPPFGEKIDIFFPAMSLSGTYIVYPFPVSTGARQVWALKWITASSGAEVGAATNLSAESVQLGGFGGQF